MTTTLSEAATKRAAVAMLRTLGATEIIVRTAVATGNDQRGLGLEKFEVAEARLSPALVKQVGDKPLRFEIVLPASEVKTKLNLDEAAAGDALRQLAGICWGDHLLRVTAVTAELFAGCAYLYKISAEG
jgi:hypothetical protein